MKRSVLAAAVACVVGLVVLLVGLLAGVRQAAAPAGGLFAPPVWGLVVGGLALLAGGALGLAWGTLARLRRYYNAPLTIVAVTLGAGALSGLVIAPLLLLDPALRRLSVATFFLAGAVLYALLLGAVYVLVIQPGYLSWRAMGLSVADLRRTAPWWPLAFLGLLAIAAGTEWVLQQLGVRQTQLDALQWLREVPPWQYFLAAVLAAVVAPIVEEIYFRGWVFRALWERYGPWAAYLGSSALFAAVHFNVQALLPILAMGLYLAYLYQRTGSIIPGIVAHACNNALAFAALYFGRP